MTTAPENRGGIRPTAPQNNPANVSGTGGAGQSGRAASGYAYGMNKQINEQAAAAPMAKAAQAMTRPVSMPEQPPITSITEPTMNPDEPITSGVDIGQGPGSIALNLPQEDMGDAEFNKSISSYYPVLNYIASRPDTSVETRRVLSILMNGSVV
jgi:hypothetical protein